MRGLAAPAGTPDHIANRLRDGFRTAYERPGFQEAARKAQLGLSFLDGEAFTQALYEREQAADQLVGWAAKTPKTTAEILKGPALVPTLAFMIFMQVVVMRERRVARVALSSVCATAVVYFVFASVLHVPLPTLG